MAVTLQRVDDPATEQNFRILEGESRPKAPAGVPLTSLPTKALYTGKQIIYKAATAVYWQLVYTGEETYPWAKIGGPPLHAFDNNTRSSGTGGGVISTGSPSVTTPLAGEYRGRYGAATVLKDSAGGVVTSQANAHLYIDGSTNESSATIDTNDFEGGHIDVGFPAKVVAAGKAMQTRYQSNNGQAYNFTRLFIEIDPLRVG